MGVHTTIPAHRLLFFSVLTQDQSSIEATRTHCVCVRLTLHMSVQSS